MLPKGQSQNSPFSINSILFTSFHTSSILLIQTCVVYYEMLLIKEFFQYLSTQQVHEGCGSCSQPPHLLMLNIPLIQCFYCIGRLNMLLSQRLFCCNPRMHKERIEPCVYSSQNICIIVIPHHQSVFLRDP